MNEIELINKINILVKEETIQTNGMELNNTEISQTQIQLIQYIIELIIKYGIPSFLSLISTWKSNEEISLEEIQNLKTIIKNPEDYLKE